MLLGEFRFLPVCLTLIGAAACTKSGSGTANGGMGGQAGARSDSGSDSGLGTGGVGPGADARIGAAPSDARREAAVLDPGTEGDGDFTIGPNLTPHPDVATKNVPHGKLFSFFMDSTKSAIFPGTTSTLLPDNQRPFIRGVHVYIPSQYVDGNAAPFMVVQDSRDMDDLRNTIDNLISARRLPRLVAIFVDNGGGDGKGSERGLEYDTMSDAYSRFIDTEVLPAVRSAANIKEAYPNLRFTDDPEGRSSYGCSSGGAAALTQGWFTPDRYRRIVTYSGTFVDQQADNAPEEKQYPLGAWEYHSGRSLIASNPPKPLRVFLHVGENDIGSTAPESGHHNWVMANQRTAAALKAKGYHYRFVFVKGSGHCDQAAVRATLPDTLAWMWRGYPL